MDCFTIRKERCDIAGIVNPHALLSCALIKIKSHSIHTGGCDFCYLEKPSTIGDIKEDK